MHQRSMHMLNLTTTSSISNTCEKFLVNVVISRCWVVLVVGAGIISAAAVPTKQSSVKSALVSIDNQFYVLLVLL